LVSSRTAVESNSCCSCDHRITQSSLCCCFSHPRRHGSLRACVYVVNSEQWNKFYYFYELPSSTAWRTNVDGTYILYRRIYTLPVSLLVLSIDPSVHTKTFLIFNRRRIFVRTRVLWVAIPELMRAYREYGIAASVANPIAYFLSSSLITHSISGQSRYRAEDCWSPPVRGLTAIRPAEKQSSTVHLDRRTTDTLPLYCLMRSCCFAGASSRERRRQLGWADVYTDTVINETAGWPGRMCFAESRRLCDGYNYDSTAIRPRYDHSTTYVTTVHRPTCMSAAALWGLDK